MAGRPACCDPVWKNVMAGSWLIASVCIDLHEAQLVDDLRGVRQQLADPRAALAVLRELELRAGQRKRPLERGHAGQALAHPHRLGQLLAVHRAEQRLVVEQLELRRAAALEQVDDPLGPRHEVRRREQWTAGRRGRGPVRRRQQPRIEQRGERRARRCPGSCCDRKCRRVQLYLRSSSSSHRFGLQLPAACRPKARAQYRL